MFEKTSNYKTALVSVEEGIAAMGFRRIAAVARQIKPDTDVFFIPVGNLYSFLRHLSPTKNAGFGHNDAELIAKTLSMYDLVCFSSMSPSMPYVTMIIDYIRKYNEKTLILLGGVHAIICQEEAIKPVDGIFTGEGEKSFGKFYKTFLAGEDFTKTPGMLFNIGGDLIKNEQMGLNTNSELNSFPKQYIGLDCNIYDLKSKKIRGLTKFDYIQYYGLSYRTIWTLGCPYRCNYCANDSFIAVDKGYSKLRYAEPEYIIDEIKDACIIHPYISTIAFYDDNFIALPLDVIKEFAARYKKEIGLPFVVFGLHPNIVNEEKISALGDAGMNRGRMGIQSGNKKMLDFYNRRTSLKKVSSSVEILAKAAKKYNMIPPAYDIITDNPLEEREDVVGTLRFLYELERPFTLTIFGLRLFPNTALHRIFNEIDKSRYDEGRSDINKTSYLSTKPSIANILLYILGVFKPPRKIFEYSLRFVRGHNERQKYHHILHFMVRAVWLGKRGMDHIIRQDFTTISGSYLYYLWKAKLIGSKQGR